MPGWFDRNNTNNDSSTNQNKPFELTDEHYEHIATETSKKLEGSLATKISELVGSALEGNPVLKRLKDNLDASAERQRKEAETRRTTAQNTQNTEFSEAYNALEPEVRTVVDARFSQVQQSALRAESRETRRSIFEDVDNFPYYTGDIRAKIDEIIDKEPLESQVNPTLIKNAYKIVIADNLKEISENKVRSRLSSASGTTTTSGTGGNADPNALPTLSDDEKRQAKNFGISEADWAKTKKDLITEGTIGV